MTIASWIRGNARPEDYYELLGRSRLDPADTELLTAIRSANRQVWPYQNHREEAVRSRALHLLRELGRAEDVFSSPTRRAAYDGELARTLLDEFQAGTGYELPRLENWLLERKQVHPDGV